MDLTFAISIAVLIVGVILYYVTTNKTQEVGRIMFAAGLLATLLKFVGVAQLHVHGG